MRDTALANTIDEVEDAQVTVCVHGWEKCLVCNPVPGPRVPRRAEVTKETTKVECGDCGTWYVEGERHACAVHPADLDCNKPTHDAVNHPAHYQSGAMEVIEVIEAFAAQNYHRGAAIKYLLRAGRKGDKAEDLNKAVWHIKRELEK